VLFVANYAGADSGSFTVAAPGTPVLIVGEGLSGSPVASSGTVTFDNLAPKGFAFVSME
jgi:hypothetical protein